MGIELPPELAEVAAATGVAWPEADEDRMREAAAAWREAAARMTALTGAADTTASAALGAFTGAAADAARAHWSAFVGPDSGHLTVTARGCLAAADRLDRAADQIGAAKVEIVRNLVDLARNTGAATVAGTPTALLGVDTAVAATAANLSAVTDTLVSAVAPNGPDVTSVRQVANANPGVRLVDTPVGTGADGLAAARGLTEAVAGAAGRLADPVAGPGEIPGAPASSPAGAAPGAVVPGGLTDAVSRATRGLPDAVAGPGGLADAGGVTGAAAGGVRGQADAVAGQAGVVGAAAAPGGLAGAAGGGVRGLADAVAGPGGPDAGGGVADAVAGGARGPAGAVGGAAGAAVGDVRGLADVVAGPGGLVDAGGGARGVTDAVAGPGGFADAVGGPARGVADAVAAAPPGAGGAGLVAPDVRGGVIGPGDEWAMDLPTPPAGMPAVVDTVHAASAAVLDAPQAVAPHTSAGPPVGSAASNPGSPGGSAPGSLGAGAAQAGPGAAVGGTALPGPRAHPGGGFGGRVDTPPADARPTEQRGGDQRGRPAPQQAGADVDATADTPESGFPRPDPSAPAPADSGPQGTAFGLAFPVGGALLGGFGSGHGFSGQSQPGQGQAGHGQPGQAQPGHGQPGQGQAGHGQPGQAQPGHGGPGAAQPLPGQATAAPVARPGAGPVLGMPVSPWSPPEPAGPQLARLPGVFAGAAIGEADRDALSLFLLHLFPIGYLPQVVDEPHAQLPAPQAEVDYAAGLRFPPDDHPDAHLVDATTPAPVSRTEGLPADHLAEGYDPLGGLHERDWDRRFLVKPAGRDSRAEYAWPPGEQYPEGGAAEGEPDVLQPGTVVDRLGTPEGRVFAPDATPFAARSLPPDHLRAGLRRYRVVRPLPVWRAASAPWFAQRGGGIRLRTTRSAVELVALGYLVEITEDGQ